MQYQPGALVTCAAVIVYAVLRTHRKRSAIKDVPRPVNPSWIFGHQWYLLAEDTGGVEKRFLDNFGNVARWNGPFGEDRLWIADPKAINHILQKSGYLYAKPGEVQERLALAVGHGIIWAQGDVHKRYRRAMVPAFGFAEAKGFLPCFMDSANKMADKWNSIVENSESRDSAIIDVNAWMGKATLDAIGVGAFGYDFGALDDANNPLTKSYMDLIYTAFGNASRLLVLFANITVWFPGLLTWLYHKSTHPGMKRFRWNKDEVHSVARKLLDSKRQELEDGTPGRDIMSLLVKAGASQRPDCRLTDEEIIPQIQSIMMAGHETTAKLLTFGLWELAKHRDFQEKLRAEINETLSNVKARGDTDFTADDFERMPCLVAFVKEVLRVHPPLVETARAPIQDDVLPLTKPIVGTSGKVYTELPVPKGTTVIVSFLGYNLNQDLWGPDAYEFRPERWFEMNEKVDSPVGVYGNLSSFSGGIRHCIGWRFAVIEVQAFLVTLIRKFDVSHVGSHPQIRKVKIAGLVSVPLVLGEEYKGTQLPLKITAIGDE